MDALEQPGPLRLALEVGDDEEPRAVTDDEVAGHEIGEVAAHPGHGQARVPCELRIRHPVDPARAHPLIREEVAEEGFPLEADPLELVVIP